MFLDASSEISFKRNYSFPTASKVILNCFLLFTVIGLRNSRQLHDQSRLPALGIGHVQFASSFHWLVVLCTLLPIGHREDP